MNVHHYQEQRAGKIAEMKALGNDLDDQKAERFDALEAEVRALDGKIARAAKLAEFERQAETVDNRFEAETRDFSITKALREGPDHLSGREREVHQELAKGRETRGVMVPTSLILGEQRAMLTSGSAGDTVATNLGGMIDRLRPSLAVQRLGATVLSGLTGNLDLPKLTGGPSAYWVAEDGATTASDSTFDKVSLAPKTVSGEMYLSRRLVLQNSVALENVLRSDLAFVLGQALDKAAIAGTGASNQPSGVTTLVAESATASTAYSDIAADLIADIEADNVDGTGGFLFDSYVQNILRKLKETSTTLPIPISATLHAEPSVMSNNVPLVSTEHPFIYGIWSNLILAYWSGVDLLANPYKDASKGGLWLHAFLDADISVRHEEAFAWKGVA
ncbi:phage major capsid protein [Mesorhizobium sp. LCM 4577]|uniref:phage major capsid protein n=1 Tax=Mesorhizobium sp. LCM 4577 TaxID=1848288 RepID=UPI000A634040|nr:phage major capsid protein [Mesorhizobium sp. LCM 4577]